MKKQLFELNSKEELEKIVSESISRALSKKNSHKKELSDELLTTDQVCTWLKMSRVSVWTLTKNGILPFLRVGNQKRYQKSRILKKLSEINHPKSPDYEKR